MIILSIETSCDETAVSIVEAAGDFPNIRYKVLGNALSSQTEIHREYGGVYPSLAKREHALTLVPLLEKALREAKLQDLPHASLFPEQKEKIQDTLHREPGLANNVFTLYETHSTPQIDLIAVTGGPGLEPALWVGINFAKALSYLWNIPVISVDHMEGHIFSSLLKEKTEKEFSIFNFQFPALALLISGGHTEFVLIRGWQDYKVIGETRDDAAGEAFDKVARMLGLPYPGGPEISKLAKIAREEGMTPSVSLPRPMLGSEDFDFSFSGLKTSVLYYLKDKKITPELTPSTAVPYMAKPSGYRPSGIKLELALEFENAVTEVLITKTTKAIDKYGIKTLILGGGVSANAHLRQSFQKVIKGVHPGTMLCLPKPALTTDNAVMIAVAGHLNTVIGKKTTPPEMIVAEGKRRL